MSCFIQYIRNLFGVIADYLRTEPIHDYIIHYEDDKLQVLKCTRCGHESIGKKIKGV